MLQTAVLFDMRAPSLGAPAPELYTAALDMAAFADEIGINFVGLMEHHGPEDGYLPSPFVMGGAIAARTKRCRINLGAVILPKLLRLLSETSVGLADTPPSTTIREGP